MVITRLGKGSGPGPLTYTLQYTIEVNQPSYNQLAIRELKLDMIERGKVGQDPDFLPSLKPCPDKILCISDELYDIRQLSL